VCKIQFTFGSSFYDLERDLQTDVDRSAHEIWGARRTTLGTHPGRKEVELRCASDPQIEAGLTIAWGKHKHKWNEPGKEGQSESAGNADAAVPGGLSGEVEYLAPGEGPDMSSQGAGNSSPASKTVYTTLTGLPLTIEFEWPFHRSTSGADFWVLHAMVRLEGAGGLHASVAVNLSATVREVLPSLEAKDTQGPIINAVRKEVDRQQLEFVKSGKLVPVHFSSRHYDFKRNQWAFGKASDETIRTFLERKIYWQTKLVGGDVWLGDETEAQYLQTTTDHLAELANQMAAQGQIKLERRYATAQPALMQRAEAFESAMRAAVAELEKKHAFERG
jgi:hypothetical protein